MSSFWDIIIPELSTNMVLNPVGGDTDNIAAAAGTTVTPKSTTYSYLGPYSIRVEVNADNEGAQYTLSALSNAIHYVTVRVRGTLPAAWDWSLNNTNFNAPSLLSTEGDWLVYGYSFLAAQANASTTLYIYQNGAGSGDFYIGHVQVEAKEYPTTPVTGDLEGCYWTGAANKSTSIRRASTRSGGRVYDLDTQYGFYLADYPNIGAPDLERYQSSLALLPGSLDEGYKVQPREFILIGEQSGTSWANMHLKRKQLMQAISPDLVAGDQPFILRYRGANSTKPVQIAARYLSGMQFTDFEGFTSKQGVRVRANDPYWRDVHESSATLTTTQALTIDYVAKRVSGTWGGVYDTLSNYARVIAKLPDGQILLGGDFTNAGDANGDYIVKYNPSTGALTSLGTGMNGSVYALAVAPDGTFYAGGSFTSAGGVANTDGIAKWNGSAWVAIAGGMTITSIRAMVFGQDGLLYVGGEFTDADGVAAADYIFKYDPAADTIAAMGSGMDGIVYGLCLAPNGYIYATGAFDSAGGVTNTGEVAYWNGSAWVAMGTGGLSGGSDAGYAICADPAGNIYVGGNFTAAGGVSALNITMWNGQSWQALGSGVNDTVTALAIDGSDKIYAAGSFNSAGGITVADGIAVWNGYSWTHLDIDFFSTPTIYDILIDGDNLYICSGISAQENASYLNTVTNNGTARAYPKLAVTCSAKDSTGLAVIEWLKNETIDATIYLNYSLQSGETFEIDFNPQTQVIESSYFGPVARAVLRASDMADFYLLPGANLISAFVNSTTDATVTSYLLWRNAYESADGAST